ncbi:MAG: heavy metal-responsive transcriptional regulator [Acidimicrobiia bacterium]|nr:MAG: heavy metal-responsive transcriptional regulator [Acidimicrobiia bacterium]
MQIGEVAQKIGMATSAIRFYEEKGLIPEPDRTDSGYRDYDPAVVDRIRFIRAGQTVGLTLRELNQVLQIRDRGESPCRHVADLLDTRIHDVDQRIEELRRLRRDLTAMRRSASRLDPADCPPEGVCRIVTETG